MLRHQLKDAIDAAEQRDDAVRVAGRHQVVDVQERGDDELHPQFLHLMDDLELQFVGVDEFIEGLLAPEQRLGAEVGLVIQRGRRFE